MICLQIGRPTWSYCWLLYSLIRSCERDRDLISCPLKYSHRLCLALDQALRETILNMAFLIILWYNWSRYFRLNGFLLEDTSSMKKKCFVAKHSLRWIFWQGFSRTLYLRFLINNICLISCHLAFQIFSSPFSGLFYNHDLFFSRVLWLQDKPPMLNIQCQSPQNSRICLSVHCQDITDGFPILPRLKHNFFQKLENYYIIENWFPSQLYFWVFYIVPLAFKGTFYIIAEFVQCFCIC